LIEDAGEEASEALQEWIREGNGPKSLYDAVMRFTIWSLFSETLQEGNVSESRRTARGRE